MFSSRISLLSRNIVHSNRLFSSVENGANAAKTARAARRAQMGQDSKQSTATLVTPGRIFAGASIVSLALVAYAVNDINENPEGQLSRLYHSSGLDKTISWLRSQVSYGIADVLEPTSDKLIPDFPDPLVYGPTPPGAVAPPLLVVDLERTLIGSVYDVQLGWRHAKRPGLDKFIQTLSQYYEIVIFSDNDNITGQEVWEAIDKENRSHHLFSNAGELRDNRILKRLDKMNRDIRRIILIDDNTVTSQLFPRNTILVQPFTDLNNTSDTVLLDLIPLLQAFVHEDVKDVRETLDALGTHQGEELVQEYQLRVSRAKQDEQRRRNTGLGGIIRNSAGLNHHDEVSVLSANSTSILSASQIVGEAPADAMLTQAKSKSSSSIPQVGFKPAEQPTEKKTGAIFNWINEKSKEKEEIEILKRNKMNEVYQKKMEEKMNKQRNTSDYV